MAFPPTAKDPFVLKQKGNPYDAEALAEGFRMTFPLSGHEFRIGIKLPKEAAHGPYMIIFYSSFYHAGDPQSLVEVGLSYSQRWGAWNFATNASLHVKDAAYHSLFKEDLMKGPPLELVVSFEEHGHAGLIRCTLAGRSQLVHLPKYESADRMRLVIATGNHTDASFSEASMVLKSVDNKPPTSPGVIEFMKGSGIDESNRRSQLQSKSSFGMHCSLLPQKAISSAKH